MTDGQSEACEANPLESELDRMRRKIEHGVPGLTIHEQRRLWELAANQKLEPIKKRCAKCDGEGMVPEIPYATSKSQAMICCRVCET